jgi:hypothetical protein
MNASGTISASKAAAQLSRNRATTSRQPDQVPIVHLASLVSVGWRRWVYGIAISARDNKKRLARHINARVENLLAIDKI